MSRQIPGPAGAPRRESLVAIGDSFTGDGRDEHVHSATRGCWPMFLNNHQNAGLVIEQVGTVKEIVGNGYRCEGHSGYTSTTLNNLLAGFILAWHRVPRIAVVGLGTNDILDGVAAATIITRLTSIRSTLLAAGVSRVVFNTLTPFGGAYTGYNAAIAELNALIRSTFTDVCDLESGFVVATMTDSDALHWNRSTGGPWACARVVSHLGF
jgi:lysophospholipase L1-like esterase